VRRSPQFDPGWGEKVRRTNRYAAAGIVTAALAAALALPAAAGAATLAGVGGTLSYAAAPGHDNFLSFSEDPAAPGTIVVQNDTTTDPITATGTCAPTANPNEYECTGITNITAAAGDGDDELSAFDVDVAVSFVGGPGFDGLEGGNAGDTLDGGADSDFADGGAGDDRLLLGDGDDGAFGGDGNDRDISGGRGDDQLEGGEGDDTLNGGDGDDLLDFFGFGTGGADTFNGGSGFDTAGLFGTPSVSGTLDGARNDGAPGENDLIGGDVEDIEAAAADAGGGPGSVTLTGDANTNELVVFFGNGTITGGNGNDSLIGGPHTDTINARDGFADRVTCGAGNDTAVVDSLDVVSTSCENVQAQDVGNANEDRPPTVAFTSPAANNARIATSRPTTLTATASDDRGVSKVQFLDDERIVCEDTTAPYTCDYRPRGEDVGRNTLSVMAVDTSQQTATAFRTTSVGRFSARRVTLRVNPRRDTVGPFRFTARGQLQLPAGVSRAQGCRGTVAVQVKAGRRTISTRRARVRSNCRYSLRVTFNDRGRLPRNGILRFQARYSGNTVLARKASRTTRVRTQ
jgi:Ca2+-binding RTX toxin-like protein